VLGEEEVAVAEATATCRLGGKHVESLAASLDCECADTILATAQKVAVFVHFLVALFVLVDLRLVVHLILLDGLSSV
jgi:hypothetical protein